MADQPLRGLRAVELSTGVAGAYCTKLLAELGADVVRIESGDDQWIRDPDGRASANEPSGRSGQTHPLFLYTNIEKRSIALDLDEASDRDVLEGLLSTADLLISDEPAHVLQQLGLTSDALAARFPSLMFVSVRPYGLDGPRADLPGYELDVFHSGGEGILLPGGLSYEMFPDRPPLKAGRHLADYDAAIAAAIAAVALAIRREKFGVGGAVDVSAQDVEVSLGRVTIDRQLNMGIRIARADRGYDFGGIFRCVDGYITVRPNEDRHWVGLATGIGREDLIDDLRFATRPARHRSTEALNSILRDWAETRTRSEIYETLAPLGTPVGYFADAEMILGSQQARERGDLSLVDVDDVQLRYPRPGYKLRGEEFGDVKRSAPRPGEHTEEIVRELSELGTGPTDSVSSDAHRSVAAGAGAREAVDALTLTPRLLDGFRVLDLGWAAAGPYAGELLALLGAEVVKIESSTRPDLFRRILDDDEAGLNESTRFNSVNLNKKSVGLNFTDADGKAVLRALAVKADIVLENMRPGVLERIGLTYDDLRPDNPDVVVVSVSNAGRGGPESSYPGYASIFNAMGGLGHLTGYGDGPPVEVRDSVDLRVGSVAALGGLAALLGRLRFTGGQAVDVSARQAIVGLVGDSILEYQMTGDVPLRDGNRMYDWWPYDVYPCAGDDQWVAVAARTEVERLALSKVVGGAGEDDLSDSADAGVRDAFERSLAAWTAARTAEETVEICHSVGVASAKVAGPDDLLKDDHLAARGLMRTIEHSRLGEQVVVGAPWRIAGGQLGVAGAPRLGEHTDEVLTSWLSMDEDEISRLAEAGVLELDLRTRIG
jgi:crotonobetainyl-CoA:carnitine CoA-transferase CaiB-like acyl-CoA transferase